MSDLQVELLQVGSYQTNCYLVTNMNTQELFIVDPGAEAANIILHIGDRKPVAVLLTHAHFDHICAADELCERYRIPLYLHTADFPLLDNPDLNASRLFGEKPVQVRTKPTPLPLDKPLTLCGADIEVMHTPGHTEGSCCFLLPDHLGVLCGDTLFCHGYGRTDLPGGSFHQLRESLRMLFHITPKIVAYPGHAEIGSAGHNPAPEA